MSFYSSEKQSKGIRLSVIIEEITIHSWWVILFMIACYAMYERALYHSDNTYRQFYEQRLGLEKEKQKLLDQQQELKLQIQSQNDPAWIELTLMRKLGLVPDGQTKIYFTN